MVLVTIIKIRFRRATIVKIQPVLILAVAFFITLIAPLFFFILSVIVLF